MSDQDRISRHDINTISSREVVRKYFNNGILISWSNTKFIQTYMVRMVWQTVMRITNEILGVYRVDTENAVLEGLLFCLFQIAEFAQPYMMSTPDSLSWPPQNPLSYFPFLSSGESQQRNLLWALLLWRIEDSLRVWKEKVDI